MDFPAILETEGEVGQQPSSGDFIDTQEQETYDLEKAKKYSVLNQSQLEIDVNSKEDDEGLIVAQGFQMFSTGASLLPFGHNQTELSGRDDHSQEVGLTSVFSSLYPGAYYSCPSQANLISGIFLLEPILVLLESIDGM